MATATVLSTNDASVLGALFDPESPLTNHALKVSTLPTNIPREDLSHAQSLEKTALLSVNAEEPSLGDINSAISQLDELIEHYPTYASGYSNRAQAIRMRFNILSSPKELRLIISDLAAAIALASPTNQSSPVSPIDAKVLASAHTHRALLQYSASKDPELLSVLNKYVEEMKGKDESMLEEMASHDFALGGKYGNTTAREMAVRTNPYAKLCGSIVKEAMRREVAEYAEARESA